MIRYNIQDGQLSVHKTGKYVECDDINTILITLEAEISGSRYPELEPAERLEFLEDRIGRVIERFNGRGK